MKPIVYFDMDGVLADFYGRVDSLTSTGPWRKDHVDVLMANPGFFLSLAPIPGAVSAYNHLADYVDAYILSTAPWEAPNAWREKRLWVEQHIGQKANKRLILSHHKNLNKGDVIIDDSLKRGVDKFEGIHIHFGTEDFPDWDSVLNWFHTTWGVPLP